ncbi:MAG: adenine deaminase [Lachnospiraceae bacterium]
MKTLLKNGKVINVFTGEVERLNILIEDEIIIGIGDYCDSDADIVYDVNGKYVCPGFIDGHIHIESTMLLPSELARVCVPHGTTSIVADPHEIANVCGTTGIAYMLAASENIPLNVYIMLPSCVPATVFDESGAVLRSEDLEPFYEHPRVLGLAEMMNYPGVLAGDTEVMKKIAAAKKRKLKVDGHAPLLSGRALDKYIAAGIRDDHECSSFAEACERIRKGQWVMIREGTSARNLDGLIDLFDAPYTHRCILVTDDKHPADLIRNGHIDSIIRKAVKHGKSAITGIQMATIQAAQCLGIENKGAAAPGYTADLLVLNDLDTVDVSDVFIAGKKVVDNGIIADFKTPSVRNDIEKVVRNSFYMPKLTAQSFHIEPNGTRCRIIKVIAGQLLTEEWITDIDFDRNNGIDLKRDILKLAVAERHLNTGHIGLGFINGIGLKKGAIASSVSHDSHNLVIIGTKDEDMAVAANRVREMGGGCVAVDNGTVIAEVPLPVAGLMSGLSAQEAAGQNELLRRAVYDMGADNNIEPFMIMSFMSLPVIPKLKMTTKGLIDVQKQEIVTLFD